MKKILLGTTAVVALATMSTEAFAADKIKLGLGGFMRHYVGVSNHDEVANASATYTRAMKLQQQSNTEVYFRGSTTLDNGLTVAVDIQKEADKSTATRTDVSAVTISSDAMGALSIGSTLHASDAFKVRVPNVVGNFDWGDTNNFAGVATASTSNTAAFTDSSSSDITNNGGKDGKIVYVSPTFSGITAYGSYTAGEGGNSNLTVGGGVTRNGNQDGYTYGVAYQGEMSGVSVSADLTHVNTATATSENHIGLNLGMAGFTVGGGYSDFSDTRVANANNTDGKAWELGVGYATGPYSVSAGYMTAKDAGAVATAGDNKDKKWRLGASYDMGAGVALSATYFHSTRDAEGAAATTKSTVSGVIAGIEVGF